MPQPVAGTFGYSPKALYAKRPHHAAGIALVAAEWAALEERMIHVHLLTVFNVPRSQEKLDEVVAERFAELFKQQIEGKFYRYALGDDYRRAETTGPSNTNSDGQFALGSQESLGADVIAAHRPGSWVRMSPLLRRLWELSGHRSASLAGEIGKMRLRIPACLNEINKAQLARLKFGVG